MAAKSSNEDSFKTVVGGKVGARGSMGPGNLMLRLLGVILVRLESRVWPILQLATLGTWGGETESALSRVLFTIPSHAVTRTHARARTGAHTLACHDGAGNNGNRHEIAELRGF